MRSKEIITKYNKKPTRLDKCFTQYDIVNACESLQEAQYPRISCSIAACDESVVHGAELSAAVQGHLTLQNVGTCWQVILTFP